MVSPADSGACDSGPALPMRKPRSGEKVRVLSALVYSAFKLLLLLSRFSRVRLCATPQTAAHQAPPSLGFIRHLSYYPLNDEVCFLNS